MRSATIAQQEREKLYAKVYDLYHSGEGSLDSLLKKHKANKNCYYYWKNKKDSTKYRGVVTKVDRKKKAIEITSEPREFNFGPTMRFTPFEKKDDSKTLTTAEILRLLLILELHPSSNRNSLDDQGPELWQKLYKMLG